MVSALPEKHRVFTSYQLRETGSQYWPGNEKATNATGFSARPGGYCRILRLSRNRLGDNGQRVILEFVERSAKEAPEAEAPAAAKASKGKKAASGAKA